MVSLSDRLRTFLKSPQGKRLISEGQRQAAKPENQRRARSLLARLRSKRH